MSSYHELLALFWRCFTAVAITLVIAVTVAHTTISITIGGAT